ncbi:cytochrome c oxidase assembly protein [Paradevosia shaoguanensis]|uniref:Cytochrome c oxidase assembly protein CtaG n=1 Tax=Paradevosia shaoguanensis TaxID=1335043 RepID=A0AA41QLP7_9HYPH|nr:cytochrome c oxidase assembly protein [Paradevosia shaoguanensis]KFL27658.1 cytochrome C oxidase assembly protein [Devosia sp. 17-2-E-8]QMV03025.1 cytochrome c oxidase assembly protein [Devosia sp. D6-9]CDP51607.1 Cytochrome oxidase biogenesis protein Cox11-CtaG, copper delivery to Cox1 [Devosia sp. DBB001]MCF1741631.1 cytochrome c oxidase assembly protein [Paradevosia shaoguanensis]MCI0126114.1 cytochrome c oxidase assembly protein [Paradevosia shaoguanensis]
MANIEVSPTVSNRNRRIGIGLLVFVAGMVGVAYAAVPLYQIFCKVTGYGGTTQVADANPKGVIDREMTVRFDANVSTDLKWTFTAAQPVTAKIGTTETINYIAVNNSDEPITGTAIFNVTPERAGAYFNKIECFCFTEQTLQPGERVEMPVVFFVDPDLDADKDLKTVREITLSYTFYASKK